MEKILSVKLSKAIKKNVRNPGDIEVSLKNININEYRTGCSGFVWNKNTGVTVYVNTDLDHTSVGYLVRYALNRKDFAGCYNRTGHKTLEEVVSAVTAMLENQADWERECKAFGKRRKDNGK